MSDKYIIMSDNVRPDKRCFIAISVIDGSTGLVKQLNKYITCSMIFINVIKIVKFLIPK